MRLSFTQLFAAVLLAACSAGREGDDACGRMFGNDCNGRCRCPTGLVCLAVGEAGSSEQNACYTPCSSGGSCPNGQLCVQGEGGAVPGPHGQCWPACGLASDCPFWGVCQERVAAVGGGASSVCVPRVR
jgi:hypothetical protein